MILVLVTSSFPLRSDASTSVRKRLLKRAKSFSTAGWPLFAPCVEISRCSRPIMNGEARYLALSRYHRAVSPSTEWNLFTDCMPSATMEHYGKFVGVYDISRCFDTSDASSFSPRYFFIHGVFGGSMPVSRALFLFLSVIVVVGCTKYSPYRISRNLLLRLKILLLYSIVHRKSCVTSMT